MINQILSIIDCKKDHKLRTPKYLGRTGNLKTESTRSADIITEFSVTRKEAVTVYDTYKYVLCTEYGYTVVEKIERVFKICNHVVHHDKLHLNGNLPSLLKLFSSRSCKLQVLSLSH